MSCPQSSYAMSRALLLKRHIIERESELLDFAKVKRDVYYELHKSDLSNDLRFQPYYRLLPEPEPYNDLSLSAAPLDLSIKSSTLTPPSTPSPCLSSRKSKDESPSKRKTKAKKQKANRKLNFDEDKSSPVSGTIIRDRSELRDHLVVQKGDIDPMYNVVEVTEEAKAELAKIENKIGDYVCKLCHEIYQDAFTLAQHRCSCIIHVEYKCPECEKVFNCPANLASHRRWHKPKVAKSSEPPKCPEPEFEEEAELHMPCPICGKMFRQQSALRKHLASHHMAELQHSLRPTPANPFAFHHIAANWPLLSADYAALWYNYSVSDLQYTSRLYQQPHQLQHQFYV